MRRWKDEGAAEVKMEEATTESPLVQLNVKYGRKKNFQILKAFFPVLMYWAWFFKNLVLEMEGNAEIYVLNNSVLRHTFQNMIAQFHSAMHYRITVEFFSH